MGATLRALPRTLVLAVVVTVSSFLFIQNCQALTASYGRPYQGHLENGVVFPNQFQGYHLRDESRSYTTPEVVGALLDAIEAVRTEFPGTCDLFLADFTPCQCGGSAIHHRSHQNGRDVDVGMYAKGNRPLNTLVPMNEDNLDAAKTWCLIENLIASQRVQYIFLDRRVQRVIYEYALTRGYDKAYLERVFGNVRGSLIQHVRNHVDHMHVRFFTPWSTLAAHIGTDETEKQQVIEAAQESYLPRKVNYYVTGSEKGLDELAHSFGVSSSDLCRWNHISPSTVLVPGSCLVFYKRSFESESVLLARSLQPGFIAQAQPVRVASLETEPAPVTVSDSAYSSKADSDVDVKEKNSERPITSSHTFSTCKARKGDTLEKIARRNKLDLEMLCQLNGIKRSARLKPGQTVKTGTAKMYADVCYVGAPVRKGGSSSICFASDSKKPNSPTAAFYTVNYGGTLKDVSKKTGIPLSSLCQLNGLGRDAHLKPGQRIKLTQANLPVRPSFGSASCTVKDNAKKPVATKHDKADKKSLKPGQAKAAQKPVAKSSVSKDSREAKGHSKAASVRTASTGIASNKTTSAKGSPAKTSSAKTISSRAVSNKTASTKAASAKTTSNKGAVKQTGKPGKPAPATVRKKTPDSTGAKVKTAAKPGKNTTIAKR